MALEELMLVNPKGKYPRKKSLQIVFPKPVRRMKVNPSAIDRIKEVAGGVTLKEVAGGIGGLAATYAVPKMLKLKGWKDVALSGGIAVGGGYLVRQGDKSAGNAFIITGLAVTGLKAALEIKRYATGKKRRRRTTTTGGLDDLAGIDDLGADFDELLGLGQGDETNDLLGDLDDITTTEESQRGML